MNTAVTTKPETAPQAVPAKPVALNRAAILAAQDVTIVKIDVPEWGGVVGLSPMTGTDLDHYEVEMGKRRDDAGVLDLIGYRAWYLSMTLVDAETGKRLFDAADVEALGNKSGKVINHLFQQAQKINGLTDAAIEDAKKA